MYKWKKYLEENDIHVPEKNEMVIDLENNDTQISTQQNAISNLLNINLISRANHANAQNIDKTTNEYKVFENFQSNLFDISFNKKTHYDRYNDIITIYDYIYNDDFHNITFDCLDNFISFENIDFANNN